MLSVVNKTRQKTPNLPWTKISEAILGKNYELSVVLIGNAKSHALNKKYRGKNKPADVLSFPLSKTSGELFLNLAKIKPEQLTFLFIHGLLHLAGLDHGSTMETKERKFLKLFGNGYPSRHRS